MIIAIWIFSLVLVAEFVLAPINLWTGRTLPAFTTFTGLTTPVARRVFAPVKLVSAALVAVGLALRPASIAGACAVIAVSAAYLIRLAAPGRRDPAGLVGFGLFGACAAALLVIQLAHPH